MSGYVKYFKNRDQDVSFLIKDDKMEGKYDEIWYVIKTKLNIKFKSEPVYDQKYMKAKVREFDVEIKTNFLGDNVPKEYEHYTCIACITIDFVMRMEKKNYLQIYLEECKYKIKKSKMAQLRNTQFKSDSESESESELDAELMAKF